MPKIDDVVNLISAVGQKDYRHARQFVEAMIANERRSNRLQAATSLERALKRWPEHQMAEAPQNIKSLVWSDAPKWSLDSLYLNSDIKSEIEYFLNERAHSEQIRNAGLPIRNRILLAGPPGNGKSSLADALANVLGLTFDSVKLHTLINSYLGSS